MKEYWKHEKYKEYESLRAESIKIFRTDSEEHREIRRKMSKIANEINADLREEKSPPKNFSQKGE